MTFSGSKGLAFHKNDILHVLNAVDDNWWSAVLVIDGNEDPNERGIIPSKMRVEKKERVKQKRVNFNGGSKSRVSFLDEQFENVCSFRFDFRRIRSNVTRKRKRNQQDFSVERPINSMPNQVKILNSKQKISVQSLRTRRSVNTKVNFSF